MYLMLLCYGWSILSIGKFVNWTGKSFDWDSMESWYDSSEDERESRTLGVRLCV